MTVSPSSVIWHYPGSASVLFKWLPKKAAPRHYRLNTSCLLPEGRCFKEKLRSSSFKSCVHLRGVIMSHSWKMNATLFFKYRKGTAQKALLAMSKDTFHRWPRCSSNSFPSNKFIHFEVWGTARACHNENHLSQADCSAVNTSASTQFCLQHTYKKSQNGTEFCFKI